MSRNDEARIRRTIGDEAFTEYAPPADPDYLPDPALDPVWHRIFAADGGRRRILAHRPGGDCHFLTPTGCRLALEVRPMVCRLYPYDYDDRTIKGVNGHFCPEPERDNPALLLAELTMNRDQAEAWRRELYRDIREEFPGSV